jgi:DNA-binding transcriptional ArsR family regulator
MNDPTKCIREKADPAQIGECKAKLKDKALPFSQLSAILSLAGSDVRLKILYLLDQEKELCPCDLSDILEISIPAVSQHLRKLKDASVVDFRKEGQTIFYSLNKAQLKLLHPFFRMVDQMDLTPETA